MSIGNPGTTPALIKKLVELIRELPEDGVILELGSGHTTEVIYNNKANREFLALEQSTKWYQDIITKRPQLEPHVQLCPLKQYDCYKFFDLTDVNIKNVQLVLLDGPAGSGRVPGAFKIYPFLAEEYTILADDMNREMLVFMMKLWDKREGTHLEFFGDDFAVLRAKKKKHA